MVIITTLIALQRSNVSISLLTMLLTINFEVGFNINRYAFHFTHEGLQDKDKAKLLCTKLNERTLLEYERYLLPDKPEDLGFDTTMNLIKLFASGQSKFFRRYQVLNLTKTVAKLSKFIQLA